MKPARNLQAEPFTGPDRRDSLRFELPITEPMKHFRHYFGFLIVLLPLAIFQGCTVLIDPGTLPPSEAGVDFSDPVLNQRRIFVVGDITDVAAAKVIRELLFLDAQNNRPIDLYLMTPGGDLKAAFAIEHAMRMIHSKVNTYALGECNSGGAMLLAAGTGDRQAFFDTVVIIHGLEPRNKPPARYIELTQESYTAFWRDRARLPEAWLPIPNGKTFILTAEQALDYGLIDKIIAKRP
jgi:ATP-dependent Clp protease protease subunit